MVLRVTLTVTRSNAKSISTIVPAMILIAMVVVVVIVDCDYTLWQALLVFHAPTPSLRSSLQAAGEKTSRSPI